MTTEPKLLTEADVLQLAYMTTAERTAFLGERGLIAPEPVDAEEAEIDNIYAAWPEDQSVRWLVRTALRRGREIGLAELTRERVRDAYNKATEAWTTFDTPERFTDLLHAALTDGEVGNG